MFTTSLPYFTDNKSDIVLEFVGKFCTSEFATLFLGVSTIASLFN